jgi:hypothetical protein
MEAKPRSKTAGAPVGSMRFRNLIRSLTRADRLGDALVNYLQRRAGDLKIGLYALKLSRAAI